MNMTCDIYKNGAKEYAWRLFVTGIGGKQNEVARMPDGTGSPWKIKRTVRAMQRSAGQDSPLWHACARALRAFEVLHPT